MEGVTPRPTKTNQGKPVRTRKVRPRSGRHGLEGGKVTTPFEADASEEARRAAVLLNGYASELHSLVAELARLDTGRWRSPAGTAFGQRLQGIVLDLAACQAGLERAAAARERMAAAAQIPAWG